MKRPKTQETEDLKTRNHVYRTMPGALAAMLLGLPSAWAALTPAQQAYVKASNTGADDQFGWSVAVSGDTMVVGAGYEDSNATGVNGNQSDNSAFQPGAAYVFTGLGSGLGPQLDLASDGSGGCFIRFDGVPGSAYRLQRAARVTGPWTTSAPQTAPASGLVEFWDLFPPPGQAFYRTVQP